MHLVEDRIQGCQQHHVHFKGQVLRQKCPVPPGEGGGVLAKASTARRERRALPQKKTANKWLPPVGSGVSLCAMGGEHPNPTAIQRVAGPWTITLNLTLTAINIPKSTTECNRRDKIMHIHTYIYIYVDVQTIGVEPATQTAGVLDVGVCKERTYRRLVSPSSRLIRSKLEKHTQHASMGLACDE